MRAERSTWLFIFLPLLPVEVANDEELQSVLVEEMEMLCRRCTMFKAAGGSQ